MENIKIGTPSKIVDITVDELQNKLDKICIDFDKGDDTHYKVHLDDGKCVMLTPYDGPHTAIVQQFPDSDDYFVEIPSRILSKQGWDENTKLEIIMESGAIILRKAVET